MCLLLSGESLLLVLGHMEDGRENKDDEEMGRTSALMDKMRLFSESEPAEIRSRER